MPRMSATVDEKTMVTTASAIVLGRAAMTSVEDRMPAVEGHAEVPAGHAQQVVHVLVERAAGPCRAARA